MGSTYYNGQTNYNLNMSTCRCGLRANSTCCYIEEHINFSIFEYEMVISLVNSNNNISYLYYFNDGTWIRQPTTNIQKNVLGSRSSRIMNQAINQLEEWLKE